MKNNEQLERLSNRPRTQLKYPWLVWGLLIVGDIGVLIYIIGKLW